MLPALRQDDLELTRSNITELENSDQVTRFFAQLGYDVDVAAILSHESLGLDAEDVKLRIGAIKKIAADRDGEIEVILFEVRSVTVDLIQAITRRFRQRAGQYLLVLTKDYEALDFVLLDSLLIQRSGNGSPLNRVIHPRILTVNRHEPGAIALRVLKRFTVTEADADNQWDKLRSAYSLAEWTEPDFNNRALFSDYYLKHRLTDKTITPAWGDDVRRLGSEAVRLIAGARERLTGKDMGATRAALIEPLFKLLGFGFTAHIRKLGAPDYTLYAPDKADKPLVEVIAYQWNRNLDSADSVRDAETPNDNPAALVVTLLEKAATPWVILTNGKFWRLYSATASNKITHYYEIDLEEALFAPDIDRETAFKYWYLMFRRDAFTGFLDKVLAESADYAKQIRERLKNRIYDDIFGYFGGGFVANMRAQGIADADIDQDRVFQSTMIFLYRLMFVLYAESLELVPVKEENGYGANSLKKLKTEVAAAAGKLIDATDEKLRAHYDTQSTALYERLRILFTGIDRGEATLNLPVYNGGLFSTDTVSGQFLEKYAIPDVYLAIGLDRLARDEDEKIHALAFIDFKSLGVRQLGSIYEGLLEFKLRIASEEMAIIKDGKREIYTSRAEAVKQKKTIVGTVKAGSVYIENTKQERKATGSYYTPDYIVKYIVEHTVGPVLDAQFAALAPRLRTAQARYRQQRPPTPRHPQGVRGRQTPPIEERWEISPALEAKMKAVARTFRKEPTPAEDVLWQSVRKEQLGFKFRRQLPIGPFIVDFYCAASRLVVEVDGPIHETQRKADQERQALIESLGITVIRFTNDQVMKHIDDTLTMIRTVLKLSQAPSDSPSLLVGEGAGGWGASSQSPELFWTQDDIRQLADDCLNIRVLDPAMGSGHFLVEVVDYISNRLIDFLNGWSENPVWALLEQTRTDILSEMERQGISIDESKLTRVVLLKRSVLKRCVYGVDLNAMAVELAKVSLWLDAFTLGAPLSFLDHHLKYGNSLIGARIGEVQDYLQVKDETIDMFSGSEFAGVMLAADLMRQVSYLSDNTISQTQRSKDSFRDATHHLEPFKHMLDVYTSRWFGNPPTSSSSSSASPSLRSGGRGRGMGGKTDTIKLFMKQDDVRAWLRDPSCQLSDGLIPATQIGARALAAAEEKHFFHWELEFPEVFFAPSKPGGQDVQLRKDAGFDAVVGNPPYGTLGEQPFISETIKSATQNNNIYSAFMEHSERILAIGGYGSFIVPLSWQTGLDYSNLRLMFLQNTTLRKVINLPFDVFSEAYVDTGIFVFEKKSPSVKHPVLTFSFPKELKGIPNLAGLLYMDTLQHEWINGRGVIVLNPLKLSLLKKVSLVNEHNRSFSEIALSARGILVKDEFVAETPTDKGNWQKFFTGVMDRYEIDDAVSYVLYGSNLTESPASFAFFEGERLLVRRLVNRRDRMMATDVQSTFVTKKDIYSFKVKSTQLQIKYLTSLLNSSLFSFIYLEQDTNATKNDFRQITLDGLRILPIRRIDFITPTTRRAQLVEDGRKLYTRSLSEGSALLLNFTAQRLAANETDVIHDLLAFLAQQMIDLNKRKQTDVKRFLGWLEKTLHIAPKADGSTGIDSLTAKTIIAGYLGDYQKGEPETAFDDFYFRLHQNRGRFGASLTEVKPTLADEYAKSLAALLPIKAQLAATDALIDRVVYQLYGLTDEEIRLIEYPGLEQAISTAREETLKEKDVAPGSDAAIEKIAEKVGSAAEQYLARVTEADVVARLRSEITGWDALPDKVRLFLVTGELALERNNLPEYSGVVISFAKAAEVLLNERLFLPFREGGYTPHDCNNEFFQKFMAGGKSLTLGSMVFILPSNHEKTFRTFVQGRYPNADATIFAKDKLLKLLDQAQVEARNGAAHDGVLTQADAQSVRQWAVEIVGYV